MEKTEFKNAKRQLSGLTAPIEKRVISWLVQKLPEGINSDHLSVIGLLALISAGFFYWMSPNYPCLYLNLVNICLIFNWFGDSLDGSLARYRNKQRPRYGFYVDHIIDTIGFFFLLGGLALSGYMSERIVFGLLIIYYMLMINSNLSAYTIGRFNISYGLFGPTELRIVLAIGNIALIMHPYSVIFGKKYLLYDVGGIVSIICMSVTFLISVGKNTLMLYRMERI